MAQQQSEIRYLTPPSVDVKKKKYCRFKKSGIKYIDYKDPEFLKKFLNEQGKILPRRITGTSLKFQRRIAQAEMCIRDRLRTTSVILKSWASRLSFWSISLIMRNVTMTMCSNSCVAFMAPR